MGGFFWIVAAIFLMVLFVFQMAFFASRYKRVPPDMALVIYGKVGEGKKSRVITTGGAMVWPMVQDYGYVSLAPIEVKISAGEINPGANGAGAMAFTIALSQSQEAIERAVSRCINLSPNQFAEVGRAIILGHLQKRAADGQGAGIPPAAELNEELRKVGLELIASVQG
jgi:flotillin